MRVRCLRKKRPHVLWLLCKMRRVVFWVTWFFLWGTSSSSLTMPAIPSPKNAKLMEAGHCVPSARTRQLCIIGVGGWGRGERRMSYPEEKSCYPEDYATHLAKQTKTHVVVFYANTGVKCRRGKVPLRPPCVVVSRCSGISRRRCVAS